MGDDDDDGADDLHAIRSALDEQFKTMWRLFKDKPGVQVQHQQLSYENYEQDFVVEGLPDGFVFSDPRHWSRVQCQLFAQHRVDVAFTSIPTNDGDTSSVTFQEAYVDVYVLHTFFQANRAPTNTGETQRPGRPRDANSLNQKRKEYGRYMKEAWGMLLFYCHNPHCHTFQAAWPQPHMTGSGKTFRTQFFICSLEKTIECQRRR